MFLFLVPPQRPVIYDGQRRDYTTLAGPYNEGVDVDLVCEVVGGNFFFQNIRNFMNTL